MRAYVCTFSPHCCWLQVLRDGSELAYSKRGMLNGGKLPALLEQSQSYWGEMKMQAALMVPCHIDTFYPRVGIATLELPDKLGVDVVYPKEQTCCGQPMANSGCSGSEYISGITVHPAQGVKTLTVILSPARDAQQHSG